MSFRREERYEDWNGCRLDVGGGMGGVAGMSVEVV